MSVNRAEASRGFAITKFSGKPAAFNPMKTRSSSAVSRTPLTNAPLRSLTTPDRTVSLDCAMLKMDNVHSRVSEMTADSMIPISMRPTRDLPSGPAKIIYNSLWSLHFELN